MLKTPPLQTATATIDTLCGRLQSATLLEDRRAAILGLRSFAKQYPASVASGSLRELISTLRRDGLGEKSKDEGGKRSSDEGTGDVDTIRLVLETLLMLFSPDANSPEAGDEIAFFMADEFSMVSHVECNIVGRTDRAKLMLAPRQHHSTPEPPRSYKPLRRLLLAPLQRATTFRHMRISTGEIARMYTICASWSVKISRCPRRRQRCCAERRTTTTGGPDKRCQ